jgi:TonB family protein
MSTIKSVGALLGLATTVTMAIAQEPVAPQVTEKMLFADDPTEWLKPTRVVIPKYPKELLDAKQGGYVDMRVTVDDRGRVKSAEVAKSEPKQPALEKSLEDVIKLWRFQEAISDECIPIEKTANVRLWFEPEGPGGKISVSRDVAPQGVAFAARRAKSPNYEQLKRELRYPYTARKESVNADAYAIAEVDGPSGEVKNVRVSAMFSNAAKHSKAPGYLAGSIVQSMQKLKFQPSEKASFNVCQSFKFRIED